ncbi:MAG: hypothetical protein ACP5PP_09110 [Fervidobacterium sp.]
MSNKVYYVSSFFWKNYNAASKAKMDVERIFQNIGLEPINLFKDGRNIRIFSFWMFIKLFFESFSNKYTESTVFFQNGTGIDILLAPILNLAFRRSKRVIIIHDVESIRFGRKEDYIREKFVFQRFNYAICHTDEMATFLREKLKFKGILKTLGFFDYIVSKECERKDDDLSFPDISKNEKFIISFAGNLSRWKSAFLHKLSENASVSHKNYKIFLYGKGYDGKVEEGYIESKGAYTPDELPLHIQGHFGLVWDGDGIDRISGTTGYYLKYNMPHKASLYIVSGLPVITWKDSACFKLVEKYNIGFGINSLLELDRKLERVTEQQYDTWKNNVENLKKDLENGKNLERLIKEIINERFYR